MADTQPDTQPDTQAEATPAATKSRQPAYVSYSMFEVFLDWLGGMDPVPARIDRQLWSQKFAPASGAQLMVGLRSLGLLDGGAPTDTLVALAKATGDARKDGLRAVLRDAYGDDLVDNLADKSLDAVEEVLRALGTTDATHRRALPFFINAAKAAGIGMQADVSKRARKRRLGSGAKKAAKKAAKKRAPATRGRKRAARKAPAAPPAAAALPPPPPPPPPPVAEEAPAPPPEPKDYAVVNAIVGRLPADGAWSAESRAQWLAALTAVVDLEVALSDG